MAERRNTDDNGDGTLERSAFDDSPGGTFIADRIEVYTHDGGGRRTRTRFDTDASDDGIYERDETHFYSVPGQSALRSHTVVDGDGDGTPDSLVFEDAEVTFAPTVQEVRDSLAGVTSIRLAGAEDPTVSAVSGGAAEFAVATTSTVDRLVLNDGVAIGFTEAVRAAGLVGPDSAALAAGNGGHTIIVITDEVLTALAGGASDYVLTIDGGSADTVVLSGAAIRRITGDGATDDGGRVGYEGTDGKVYVDQMVETRSLSLVSIETTTMPSGTEERWELDREGDGTVDEVRSTTFSDSDDDGTADISRTDEDYDGTVDRKVERVEWDRNADGTVGSTEIYTYDAAGRLVQRHEVFDTGAVYRRTYRYDGGGRITRYEGDKSDDGTTFVADEVNTYRHDAAGKIVRIDFDGGVNIADPDGTVDQVNTYSYDAAGKIVRIDFDGDINIADPDGTANHVRTYSYDAADRVVQIDFDGDWTTTAPDGTADRTEILRYADNGTSQTVTVFEFDADGTVESAEFASRAGTWEIWAAAAEGDLTGLPEITMAADADGTVVITDAVLTALAGSDSAYSLRVDGDSGDTVRIAGSGVSDASTTETVGGQDYDVYQGTDGNLLVDPDLQVAFA